MVCSLTSYASAGMLDFTVLRARFASRLAMRLKGSGSVLARHGRMEACLQFEPSVFISVRYHERWSVPKLASWNILPPVPIPRSLSVTWMPGSQVVGWRMHHRHWLASSGALTAFLPSTLDMFAEFILYVAGSTASTLDVCDGCDVFVSLALSRDWNGCILPSYRSHWLVLGRWLCMCMERGVTSESAWKYSPPVLCLEACHSSTTMYLFLDTAITAMSALMIVMLVPSGRY